MADSIYQLKVTLLGTKPPIWRRLLVPANQTLADLHEILQVAFGWQDCHLHEFLAGSQRYGIPNPEDRAMGLEPTLNERRIRLAGMLPTLRAKAIYVYDFGDSWEHSIILEKILAPDPELRYPMCIGGKLHGPPEDCGGVGGYYQLLNTISNPKHPEHEDMLEWLGEEFDPQYFSKDDVNAVFAPPKRRKK